MNIKIIFEIINYAQIIIRECRKCDYFSTPDCPLHLRVAVTFNQTAAIERAPSKNKSDALLRSIPEIHTVKTLRSHPILHSIYGHENGFLRDDPPLPLAIKR